MRLIDADTLPKYTGMALSAVDVARAVENSPTVDLVKHGEWMVIPQRCENQTFDECKCSVCGTVEYFNSGWKKFNYCPTCGARMDGGRSEE